MILNFDLGSCFSIFRRKYFRNYWSEIINTFNRNMCCSASWK